MDERYAADNVIVLATWMCVWREQGTLSVSYSTPFVDRPKKDSKVFNVWRQWWNQFSEVYALKQIMEYRQVTGSPSYTYIQNI